MQSAAQKYPVVRSSILTCQLRQMSLHRYFVKRDARVFIHRHVLECRWPVAKQQFHIGTATSKSPLSFFQDKGSSL